MIEAIGFMAGSLVVISVLPQILKSWRTKSTKDIAISWSIINLMGQALWIYYGFLVVSYSLMVMSSIALIMNTSMIVLKLKYG